MSDLIDQNDAQASMANMLKDVGGAGQIWAQHGQAGFLERRGGSNNRGCRAGAYGLLLFFFFFFLSFS